MNSANAEMFFIPFQVQNRPGSKNVLFVDSCDFNHFIAEQLQKWERQTKQTD